MRPDRFAALYPADLDRLRVAWDHLRIPGPPPDYALTSEERTHPDPQVRFARRTIQKIHCGQDRLAMIDKVSPHSLFDLMVSETSVRTKATPDAVEPLTGRTLWRTGSSFVRFVSDPEVMTDFDLADGELHLALNCDPNTNDRESVQAAKQFHLHLLYWPGRTLDAVTDEKRFGSVGDPWLRRQAIDPLTFLGVHLAYEVLADLDLGINGARFVRPDDRLMIRGGQPLGCLIELPGWGVLDDPAFEDLIRRLHIRLETLARDLLEVFTGQRTTPPPWQRHRLRPRSEIAAGIAALPLSAEIQVGLNHLAQALRDLPQESGRRLRETDPMIRRDLMTLNQPSYAMNLFAPIRNRPAAPLSEAAAVHLTLQPKLFSGIGGAGLLCLRDVPSVRIIRGEGVLTPKEWSHRAAFQRRFAQFNQAHWTGDPEVGFETVKRFAGSRLGWIREPTQSE